MKKSENYRRDRAPDLPAAGRLGLPKSLAVSASHALCTPQMQYRTIEQSHDDPIQFLVRSEPATREVLSDLFYAGCCVCRLTLLTKPTISTKVNASTAATSHSPWVMTPVVSFR